MADIEVVIKISEEEYKLCKSEWDTECLDELMIAVKYGTPLPEHHSRLIDADSLIKAIEEKAKRLSNTDTINGLCGAVALIFEAPTIIEEADKENEQ